MTEKSKSKAYFMGYHCSETCKIERRWHITRGKEKRTEKVTSWNRNPVSWPIVGCVNSQRKYTPAVSIWKMAQLLKKRKILALRISQQRRFLNQLCDPQLMIGRYDSADFRSSPLSLRQSHEGQINTFC